VFWDPVLSGREYVTDLEAVQAQWLETRPQPRIPHGRLTMPELIGFPLTQEMRRGFEAVDLGTIREFRAKRLTVLVSSDRDRARLEAYLRTVNVPSSLHFVPSAGDWYAPAAVHRALLPHEIIQAIAGLLTVGVA
jgi:hypothetical protein